MARTLTAAVKTELNAASKRPVFAAEFDFTDGFTRLHSGHGDLTLDGNTYTGAGDLLAVEFPAESTSKEVATGSAVISGVPSGTLTDVLPGEYKGRNMSLWIAFLNSNYAIIADAVEYKFRMDTATINEGGEFSSVSIVGNSRHTEAKRPANLRYTKEDQAHRHPLDTGLQWMSQLQDARVNSGTKLNSIPFVPAPPYDEDPAEKDFYDGD